MADKIKEDSVIETELPKDGIQEILETQEKTKILMGLPDSEIEDQIEEMIDMAKDQDQTILGLENEMT